MELDTDCDIVTEVLEDCPNCGSKGVLYRTDKDEYFVACGKDMNCARTERCGTIQEAINDWNERELVRN